MESRVKKTGIRSKIKLLIMISLIPMAVTAVFAVAAVSQVGKRYDRIVRSITTVNEFNSNFEKDMNRSMYYITVGSYTIGEKSEPGDVRDPYVMIEEFRSCLEKLRANTDDVDVLGDIEAIDKMLDSLGNRIDDIVKNVEEGGHYDENMEMLRSNIYVLTNLIQQDISDYIYLESLNMENARKAIAGEVRNTLVILLVLIALLFLATILVSERISRKITDPLRRMCDTTERFAGGDFSVRFNADTGDEIETLSDSFNSMVSEIAKLVEDIKIEQEISRDTELRLLQEQINPHFLYNTLDAIVWLIEAGDHDQAVSMISTLSQFFRTTLSKGREWITVEEEESHIRSYLEIQQFRYRDILDYEIDIPDAIGGYSVMKLMLQPIVENALYHGIKNKRGKGLIRVTGEESGGDLIFRVEDNGIGMTEAELSKLRKLISGELTDTSRNGFGIANVEQRIRLNYGSGYGIGAESTYGKGSVVTLRIPKVLPKG